LRGVSKARAKARRRGGEKWEWVIKPGDRIFVSRTAAIPSKKLSRREFKVLEEVVNIYSKILGDMLTHTSRNIIENHRI
jgi:hypothetical protein